jgi:hypothetical protein
MSKRVSLFKLGFTLRTDSKWSAHNFDALIEAVVLSGAVPVFAGERRIDHLMTPETTVDVLRERVSIPAGVDPSALGTWSVGLPRFKCFEPVYVDEAKALAWLCENVGGDMLEPVEAVEPVERKAGRKSKKPEYEARYAGGPRPRESQVARELGVHPRTVRRWRKRG